MELALNTGAFEALDQREMQEVDGGGPLAWMIAGFVLDGIVEAATGKSTASWVATGIKAATQTIKHIRIIQPAYTNP